MSTNTSITENIISIEDQFRSGLYSKREIAIVHGKGAILWDAEGKEFIDCSSSHGVANVGHSHPAISQAIATQSSQLISCPETFYNDQRSEYISSLTDLMPNDLKKIFLCNSGTEAIEAAIKLAKYSSKRTEIVAAMRGFHGRTMGALSATWNKKYRQPFEPLVPGYIHVPYNNIDKMKEVVTEKTAAVLLEIVQGEGGVYLGDPLYLERVQELCRENGALLIFDEVQTGFGRTGKMFAFQHYGLNPDIICLAKSIAGGLPMGAIVFGTRIGPLLPGLHASTFGGNPLASAAASAVLKIIEEENLVQKSADLGVYFREKLRRIDSDTIREVRGLGLMIGIELKKKATPYLNILLERGVIALPAGLTVIRLLPPLVITKDQIDYVIDSIEEILSK